MFKAIGQFFAFITSFFSAMEKLGNAVNSIASVAEDTADTFYKEEYLRNQDKLAKLKASMSKLDLPQSTEEEIETKAEEKAADLMEQVMATIAAAKAQADKTKPSDF